MGVLMTLFTAKIFLVLCSGGIISNCKEIIFQKNFCLKRNNTKGLK